MSPQTNRGLGRGFDALISNDFNKDLVLSNDARVLQLAIDDITPNPQQPRTSFDETALNELAQSIKAHGVVQPLVVSPGKNNKYTLVAGERRWRAARLAGLTKVPAISRSHHELEQLEIALIENVQRVDLNPIDQALSIQKLHEQFSLSYEEIAKRLGKANSTVNNIARLLKLPGEASQALIDGKISEGHARAILAIKNDPERQLYLLKMITSQGWSVRQAERFVLSVKAGTKQTEKLHEHVATETAHTKKLSQKLGTTVNIRRTARGGKLEISFQDDEQLDSLLKYFD